jgi:predicted nucleic acid-binding protein
MPDELKIVICDANIVIDYLKTEPKVLQLYSKHIATLYITPNVVSEIHQFKSLKIEDMGFVEIEPNLNQVLESADRQGRLSGQDKLCLILARDNGFGLVTNDVALRKKCKFDSIEVIWGLSMMMALCEKRLLSKAKVISVAKRIEKENVRLTAKVVRKFEEKINEL